MFRKNFLRLVMLGMLAVIVLNGYLAFNNFRRIQNNIAIQRESSGIRADISGVLQDLTEMETAQRGYLLTGNSRYLLPYDTAEGAIRKHLASLRSGLATRGGRERFLVTELETLSNSKQAEMRRTIDLRQQGYRLRAFMIVDTNEGKEYMDTARQVVSALSDAESSRSEVLSKAMDTSVQNAFGIVLTANLCCLVLALVLFGLLHGRMQELEHDLAKRMDTSQNLELRLNNMVSVLSGEADGVISNLQRNVGALLQNYGGFLPRQGHECAEEIEQAAIQMKRIRQDLLANLELSLSADK